MASVRRAMLWSLIGQALSIGSLLLATVVLARILDPREMGIYAMGLAVNGILQIITAFGLATFITREERLNEFHLRAAFTINAILGVALAAVTLAGSFVATPLFGAPGVGDVLRLLAFVPLIGAFELIPVAMMQREMRFGPISTILSLRSIGSMIVTIVSALLGASYLSAGYGAIAFAMIGAVGANIAAPGHLVILPSLAGWRQMAAFGARVMSIGGFSMLAVRFSEIAMGRILGLATLGIYSRASTIYNVVYANIFGTAARVLMAKLAADNRATGDLKTTYLQGMHITLALMWPFLIGIALVARPLVRILFGAQWLDAASPLAILMVAQAISMMFAMSYELFVLRDELARQTRYELFRSVCGFVFFTAGCFVSMEMAAVGRLGDVVVGAILYIPHIKRLAVIEDGALRRIFGINAFIAAAAIVPTAGLMISVGWSADTPLPMIVTSALIGGAFWLAALWLTGHALYDEIRRFGVMIRIRLFPRRNAQ
ncbi:MAG: oligosaccharide flippase family protein [Sphingomonas bacterium]|nr:oligosaccharide flippase family protein [Sphingomonas bacterium]